MSGVERASRDGVNAAALLQGGDIEPVGLLPYSSNYAFLCKVTGEGEEALAVYKPARGERPLWDFPHGTLAAREVAAYLVAEYLGPGIVPPTVMRADAPHGPGSLQLFIDHDPDRHYFVLIHELRDELRDFAILDIVINNADRKGGHVLQDEHGRLWGVDHGLSFNVEPKLRTVVWAFAGEKVPGGSAARLIELADDLGSGGPLATTLEPLLTPEEVEETQARARALVSTGRFPEPTGPFHMPWPLV